MIIQYSKKATKALIKIPRNDKERIVATINKLANKEENKNLDIKKLQGLDGYRLRIGNYRVIYDIYGTIIDIEDVFHRQKNYKQ